MSEPSGVISEPSSDPPVNPGAPAGIDTAAALQVNGSPESAAEAVSPATPQLSPNTIPVNSVASVSKSDLRRDPPYVRAAVAIAVTVFILAVSVWSFRQGMRIRREAWEASRANRFEGDISNGMRWGLMSVDAGQRLASQNLPPDSVQPQAYPEPGNDKQRPLNLLELLHGEMQLYRDRLAASPDGNGDYGLDYPPARLAVMAWWSWMSHRQYQSLNGWPGEWRLMYFNNPQNHEATEDVAQPVLHFNSACEAISAVLTGLLVAVWTWRGGRPWRGRRSPLRRLRDAWASLRAGPADDHLSLAQRGRRGLAAWFATMRRDLVPWKPVRLSQAQGLVVFPITLLVLMYGMAVIDNPVPSPPPSVQYTEAPRLTVAGEQVSATLSALVNPQGALTSYDVEWGTTPEYGHKTAPAWLVEGGTPQLIHPILTDLPRRRTIYWQIVARNDSQMTGFDSYGRGTTRGAPASFETDGDVPALPSLAASGDEWPDLDLWLGLGVVFAFCCWALRVMPPIHRAWGMGLLSTILFWFDPSLIVDAHIWPQWDVWTLPPFLLGALLASLNWWFLAGVALGAGIMFKGQLLLVLPLLALWPLFLMQWGRAARLVGGTLLGSGILVSPWFVFGIGDVQWHIGAVRFVESVLAAAVVAGLLSFYRRPLWRRAAWTWGELARIRYRHHVTRVARGAAARLRDIATGSLQPMVMQSVVPIEATGSAAVAESPTIADSPTNPKLAGPIAPSGVAPIDSEPPDSADPTRIVDSSAEPPFTSNWDLMAFCLLLMSGVVVVTLLLLKRWPSDAELPRSAGVWLLLLVLLPPWFIRRLSLGVWVGTLLGVSIWMSAYLYHGDWSWKTLGFDYGARKHEQMVLSNGSNGTVSSILMERFGWDLHDTALTLHLPDLADSLHIGTRADDGSYEGWVHDFGLDGTPLALEIRQVLGGVFLLAMILCSIGAAIQSQRNNPRFMAALVATWVIFPDTLTQMAARYHLWGASLSSSLVVISGGMVILHGILSSLAAGMVWHQLMDFNVARSPQLHTFFQRLYPDEGWILCTIGWFCVYLALSRGRRPARDALDTESLPANAALPPNSAGSANGSLPEGR